ncbi:MAG: hypothetical protein M5U31_09695 [Acidimicrobiia bacterium]|nr:hypothetical protein [Acidimicrobiia bacterium]
MSETGTSTQAPDAGSEDQAVPDGAMNEGGSEGGSNVRERLLVPIMIPALVVVIVAFVAINVSRIFLATAGAVAVGIAIALMVGIMALAAWLSANERLRSSTASIMAVAALFLVLSAGLTTLGAAEGEGGEEGGLDALPVDSAIEVDAGNFFLTPKPDLAPPGVIEFTYVNTEPGLHTLLIEEDPTFGPLTIDGPDATDVGNAQLEAGAYTLFCDIPGHRQQGMETTITIEEGAPTVGGDESEGTGATPGGTPEDQPVEG